MGEDLINQFWDDYCKKRGQRETRFALQKLLKGFRETLGIGSKTAYAIHLHQPLDTIIQCAKEEGFIEFAQTVSFAKKHLD